MNLRTKGHWITLGLLFLAAPFGNATADPVPGSVQGNLGDGAELIVTGSGFGAKSQAAPIFFDTQDDVWINGAVTRPYADLNDNVPVPVGGSWPWKRGVEGNLQIWRSGGHPRYGATFDSQFTHDAWIDYPGGFPDVSTKSVTEVYIRWWFKMSVPVTQGGSGSNKFARVWDSTGSDSNGVRISWTQMHLTYDNGGPSWSQTYPNVGQWNLMEMYVRTAPNPTIQTWMNGSKIYDVSGYVPGAGYQGLQPRLWGMDGSGDANFSGGTVELSDYYADSTRARVEIGDAPQWSNVKVREPQVASEWGQNQITFQVHQGMLDSLLGAYLYVIDADGKVNQTGLPLDGVAPPAQMPQPSVQ